METNKIKNKIENKYNTIEKYKKILLVLNKNSILGLLIALNTTNNIVYSKLLIIHCKCYPIDPFIFDFVIFFNPILIF